MKRNNVNQRGGVSLFIVIFSALIVTIITVGFTQFVIRGQQQILDNDLSQRAYNSALAGVEDGKRVLVAYTKECSISPETSACTRLRAAIQAENCDTISSAGLPSTTINGNDESTVGQPSDNQAYTCVKILLKSNDYNGEIKNKGDSTVVHLKGTGNYTDVRVSWFTKQNAGNPVSDIVSFYTSSPALLLPNEASWSTVVPPIMRAQYVPAAGTQVSSLDTDAKTAFMYPVNGGTGVYSLASDTRRASGSVGVAPTPAKCVNRYSLASQGGVCSMVLSVPTPTNDAYLQLTSLYNKTNFTVELLNSGSVVQFDGVAPVVDSTGRASDLFRRVNAQVSVGGIALPYPTGTITSLGNLCKAFTLQDAYTVYSADSRCEP